MSRFVDYFFICGYDHTKGRSGNHRESKSQVIQRFPEKDWPGTPFSHGIDMFCQPNGWVLNTERQEPSFFVSVLTDVEGKRLYCACLSFSEAVSKEKVGLSSANDDLEDDGQQAPMSLMSMRGTSLPRHAVPGVSLPTGVDDSVMYAPKCLALVSSHDMTETFRNCLGLIYTVYTERMVGPGGEPIKLETLVGNLLGLVNMPSPGSSPLKFSLGGNDRQILQPPTYPDIPVSGMRVALLFQQLGIRSVLTLFSAVLTEQKILFYSSSFSRLTDSCTALISLIYPMRYSHTLIPVLPSLLLEVLSSPTPYIIGVHSQHREHIDELLDVITVDLDGGMITIPENMTIHQIMEPLRTNVAYELSLVFHPELYLADNAFRSNMTANKSLELLDKELRAVMLRLMTQLLQGYRSCLTLVRIHPQPFITFHKAAFLGLRNISRECDFIPRFLDCMFLNDFINQKGTPWRTCDIFDELYANIGEHLALELTDPHKILTHIEDLAKELYENENCSVPNGQNYSQRIPLPTEGHMMRVHQPVFPSLDAALVAKIIEENQRHNLLTAEKAPQPNSSHCKLVPMGQRLAGTTCNLTMVPNSARRLEVLRNCISNIFENKISDVKKTFPAVIRALKSKAARLALCEELRTHVSGNQTMLEHQQFDLIVRLMNAALQDDSDIDMHGVAAALVPLATTFGRKLCPGVIQFAYTLIQDHAVWKNLQFWESAFFNDVQNGIKDLYLAIQEQNLYAKNQGVISAQLSVEKHVGPRAREVRKSAVLNPQEPSVLEIAANEIKKINNLTEGTIKERITNEEQTVYAQAVHYTAKMVYFLIPMDFKPERNGKTLADHSSDMISNSISNSVADTDSIDAESGFDDTEPNDNGIGVITFVSRFVDKVCGETSVNDNHMKALHQMVQGLVAMHLETMEAVSREAKRLPPIQKPKFHSPSLLPGEELVCEGLRVYLLSDGREEYNGGVSGGAVLLPAEGAIFLTNYRVIFKGSPIDPFSSEHTITRSFPVTSLTREKRFSLNEYLSEIDQTLKEGIQLRSSTFQLIRAAFDDEVTVEEINNFRNLIHKTQFPPTFWHLFAFRTHITLPTEPLNKEKDKAKYSTIRGFASKTLKNVGKATGLKTKNKKSHSKYMLPNMQPMHGRLSVAEMMNHETKFREDDELSEVGDVVAPPVVTSHNLPTLDSKGLERLSERRYYKDWVRLGLGSLDLISVKTTAQPTEATRISIVNHRFAVARSLPSLLVVPGRISDDSLKRFSKVHKQSRFPTITWRHKTSKALLVRGSSYHNKGMMNFMKRHQENHPGQSHETHVPSSLEAEQFLAAVIAATPAAVTRPESSWNMAGSTTSVNSLSEGGLGSITTPTLSRRNNNPFSKAMEGFGTLTRSSVNLSIRSVKNQRKSFTLFTGGKSGRPFGGRLSLSSVKGKPGMGSQSSLTGSGAIRGSYRASIDSDVESSHTLQKAILYVFGEKSQRGVKMDSHPKADFIPVDYPEPRRLRASFKKLMQACAPSTTPQGSSAHEKTFHKLVEQSEWLQLLQSVMQLAGAVTDLMDIQGSSVMLCLEDGWDLTCQVSSLAQLCLDPHYRTLEGFRTLIEKEWIAFGHRFNHRSNIDNSSQDTGFTPLFLQFLDIVHQLHNQFPMAFEFSHFYLKFLAYHHVSCRFRTFLLDSELQRSECGFTQEEKKSSLGNGRTSGRHAAEYQSSDEETGGNSSTLPGTHLGLSVFDYIERASYKSPLFHNPLFCPELQQPVLRPFSHMSDLVLWDYYIKEELRYGPSYDLEIAGLELQQEQEVDSMTEQPSMRLTKYSMTHGYDNIVNDQPDITTHLLKRIEDLETELGHLPHRWQHHWSQLEPPPPHPPPPPPGTSSANPAQVTTPSMYARHYGRSVHKRSTIELLLRGKMGPGGGRESESGGGGSYTHPHRFEKYNYTTPTYCDLCNSVLWGIVRTGFRCQDCGLNCHEKCRDHVPKACTKYKSVTRDPTSDNLDQFNPQAGVGSQYVGQDSIGYQFNTQHQDEHSNITCQGYLYKRGALLKAWKQRWFVLDTIKHQLRYYDTREDFHCKGSIDLSEMKGVSQPSSVPPGAPKKADDRCFFDLQTSRRTYSLCAESIQQAVEWQEKIQNCL